MNEQDREDPTPDNGDSPSAPLLPRRIYHAWWIVLVGAGILMLTAFADSNMAEYVFEPPDTNSRGLWVLGTSPLISLLVLFPFRPFLGHFVDLRGPLVPVTVALLIGGFAYIVLAVIGPSWPSYSAAILIATMMATTARIAMLTTVANLFSQHLGKAFAVVLIGASGATVLRFLFIGDVFLLVRLITDDDYGLLQITLVALVGIMLCISGLAFLFVLRRWPVWDRQGWQMGRNVLDAPTPSSGEEPETDSHIEPSLTLGEILTSRSYYLYVAATALYGSIAWPLSLIANAESVQLSFVAFSLSAIFAMPAILIIGALSDRFDRKLVVTAMVAVLLISTLPLAVGLGAIGVVAPVALGFAFLGAGPAAFLALQWECFGRRHFGLLLGIQASVAAFFSVLWPPVATYFHDFYGDQAFVLVGTVLPLAIALVLILLMKRPQYRNTPAEREAQAAA